MASGWSKPEVDHRLHARWRHSTNQRSPPIRRPRPPDIPLQRFSDRRGYRATGTVFVAWQEKVGPHRGNAWLWPARPRWFAAHRYDALDRWRRDSGPMSTVQPATEPRSTLGDRDSFTAPPPGFGALPDEPPSGPAGDAVAELRRRTPGPCLLRVARLTSAASAASASRTRTSTFQPVSSAAIDRVVDFRAALLDPATGQLEAPPRFLAIPISADADLIDGEQVDDVAAVQPEACQDGFGALRRPASRASTLMNKPQSGSGEITIHGRLPRHDPYRPVRLRRPTLRGWRWATEAGDLPYQRSTRSSPTTATWFRRTYPGLGEQEWERYQYYGPPGSAAPASIPARATPTCSRRRLDAELIVSAPTTYKQLDARRGFPIRVQNGTGVDRFYRLTITEGTGVASFSTEDALTRTAAIFRSSRTPVCRRSCTSIPISPSGQFVLT